MLTHSYLGGSTQTTRAGFLKLIMTWMYRLDSTELDQFYFDWVLCFDRKMKWRIENVDDINNFRRIQSIL